MNYWNTETVYDLYRSSKNTAYDNYTTCQKARRTSSVVDEWAGGGGGVKFSRLSRGLALRC